MIAVRLLHDRAFGRGRDLLHLRDRQAIAGDKGDRDAELAGERGIVDAFRHFHAVQFHAEQPRARNRVATNRVRRPLARVVADEHRGGERVVDPLHHLQRARKSTHDPHIVREPVDEDALSIPVRVADDDVRGTGVAVPGDGGIYFRCHPFARALILEPLGPELRRLNDAGDALHVDGDENFAGPRLGLESERRDQQGRDKPFHRGPF